MKIKTPHFILLIALLSLTACSYIYVPNAVNVPLIGEKGEVHAAVFKGTSNVDIQAAYGLTDKIAIMANGSFANRYRTKIIGDSTFYHIHNLGEIACGYYNKVGRSGRIEVFGGLGYGTTTDYDQLDNYGVNVNGKYGKIFIQPNVGSVSDVFDGAMSLRLVYVKYFDFNYAGTNYKSKQSIFVEPVMTGKIGYKYLKFIVQAGISIPVIQDKLVLWNPLILNIGLDFNINTLKTKPMVK